MKAKKTIVFEIEGMLDAIDAIAKKQGFLVRRLKNDDLKMLIETGSLEVEAESIRNIPVITKQKREFPFELFKEMMGRAHGLTVFVNNISEELLYKYAMPIINKHPEKDFLLRHYISRDVSFPAKKPNYKTLYGDEWQEKLSQITNILFPIGKELVEVLQVELRKTDSELVGIKNFSKNTVVADGDSLGLSCRAMPHEYQNRYRSRSHEPFVLGEVFNSKCLLSFTGRRNMGEQALREIEDFLLLYGLN